MATDDTRLNYPVPRESATAPPAAYAEQQRDRPVCPIKLATGFDAVLVTRYPDVKQVLSDTRFSRDALFEPGAARSQLAEPDRDSLISIDPPRHTRLRALINREFSPRRVERMRPLIQKTVDDLLDAMALMSPPVDLNEQLGRPLALQMICELLGVPYADHARFGSWCDHFMAYAKYPLAEVGRANTEMRGYLEDLINRKRVDPGEDLLSSLVHAQDADGAITQSELVSMAVLLLLAGHDTTVTAIGGGLVTLLRYPEQLEEVRRDPRLMPQVVDELVRLNEPGDGSFLRIVTEDLELAGTKLPKGTPVIASISTADRDPDVFDHPDELDIHRKSNPHIAFGHGTHFCVGSSLGRAEIEIALNGVLERFPTMALAVPEEELEWRSYAHLGGIEAVPVTW